jgi:hypothetical protein
LVEGETLYDIVLRLPMDLRDDPTVSAGSRSTRPKPLAIVVVGGMLVTLLPPRYLMPVLSRFFPAPLGPGARQAQLLEGSYFTDEILRGQDSEPKSSREDRL